ncbi:hypothetical protein BT69DRAFT_1329724 [Atractiella rhizophila]|nr:hypothetical protein BT69DRAFT_1329724 [Atractiella rhizophila]
MGKKNKETPPKPVDPDNPYGFIKQPKLIPWPDPRFEEPHLEWAGKEFGPYSDFEPPIPPEYKKTYAQREEEEAMYRKKPWLRPRPGQIKGPWDHLPEAQKKHNHKIAICEFLDYMDRIYIKYYKIHKDKRLRKGLTWPAEAHRPPADPQWRSYPCPLRGEAGSEMFEEGRYKIGYERVWKKDLAEMEAKARGREKGKERSRVSGRQDNGRNEYEAVDARHAHYDDYDDDVPDDGYAPTDSYESGRTEYRNPLDARHERFDAYREGEDDRHSPNDNYEHAPSRHEHASPRRDTKFDDDQGYEFDDIDQLRASLEHLGTSQSGSHGSSHRRSNSTGYGTASTSASGRKTLPSSYNYRHNPAPLQRGYSADDDGVAYGERLRSPAHSSNRPQPGGRYYPHPAYSTSGYGQRGY